MHNITLLKKHYFFSQGLFHYFIFLLRSSKRLDFSVWVICHVTSYYTFHLHAQHSYRSQIVWEVLPSLFGWWRLSNLNIPVPFHRLWSLEQYNKREFCVQIALERETFCPPLLPLALGCTQHWCFKDRLTAQEVFIWGGDSQASWMIHQEFFCSWAKLCVTQSDFLWSQTLLTSCIRSVTLLD